MKGDRDECGCDKAMLCDDRQAMEVKEEDGGLEDERLSAFYFGSCSCRSRRYKVQGNPRSADWSEIRMPLLV